MTGTQEEANRFGIHVNTRVFFSLNLNQSYILTYQAEQSQQKYHQSSANVKLPQTTRV